MSLFGSSDIIAYGEGRSKALTPGMIGSRYGRQSLLGESEVKLLSRNHFRLPGLLVVNGAGQGFATIQDGNGLVGIHAHSDLRIAQSVSGTLGLDLVDGLLKLEG